MSDCARRMQPPESERERERAESSALASAKPYYFLSHVPRRLGAVRWASRRQQCARDLYKKASHPAAQGRASRQHCVVECARDACLLCTRRRAHTMHAQQIYKRERRGAYLHLKAAAASGLRALSLSEVIVSGAHCTCGLWCLYVAIGLILFKAKIFVYTRTDKNLTVVYFSRLASHKNISVCINV